MSAQRERKTEQVVIVGGNPPLEELCIDMINPNKDSVIPTTIAPDLKSLVAALARPTRLIIGDLSGPASHILKMMKEGTVPEVRTISISDPDAETESIRTEYPNVIATFTKPIPNISVLDDLIQEELHGRGI